MDLFITFIVIETIVFGLFGIVLKLKLIHYVWGFSIVALISTFMVTGWWVNATFLVPPTGGQMAFVVLAVINAIFAWIAYLIYAGQYAETLRRR